MTTNKIELNQKLKDQFEELFGTARKSILEQVKLASLVRNQYLDANGRKYVPEFQAFWKDYSMDGLFKSLSNFTKYASAGDAISKVEKRFEQYFNRLPMSVNALYEISQLRDDELELCLQNTYKRFEITSDRSKWKFNKKPKPLINPQATAAEISSWRKNWNNPKATVTDKRRLKLAEIYIHGSLYDFDRKTAEFIGKITKEYVQAISDALVDTVGKFDEELVRLDLKDEALFSGHYKREAAAIKLAKVATEKRKKKEVKSDENIKSALEICLKENPRWVPWRFRKLAFDAFKETEIRDFNNPKIGKKSRKYVTEISIPTIGQFKQYLGKRFLENYGPRKLCSLIQRCSTQGPWAEKIEIVRKNKSGKSKKFVCSKLEYELTKHQKINQANIRYLQKNTGRYEELQVTMSPDLMAKSDNELLKICEKWIEELNEPDTPISHI